MRWFCLILMLFAVSGLWFMFRLRNEEKENIAVREKMRLEAQKARWALYHDALTECYNNRAYFEDREGVLSAKSLKDSRLLFVALSAEGQHNSLKTLNDSYGYECGDLCIRRLSEAIREVFRDKAFTVYYQGASGFFVLGSGSYSRREILQYYNELKTGWHDAPFELPGGVGQISGMALQFFAAVLPDTVSDGSDLESLVFERIGQDDHIIPDNCGYYIMLSNTETITNFRHAESTVKE